MKNGKELDRPVVQNPALSTIFSKQVMGHADLMSLRQFDAIHRPEASWQHMLLSQPPIIGIEVTLLQHGLRGQRVGGVVYSMPGHHLAGSLVTAATPLIFHHAIRMGELMQESTSMFGQEGFLPKSVTLAMDQTEKWVVAECDHMTTVDLQCGLRDHEEEKDGNDGIDKDLAGYNSPAKRNAEAAFEDLKEPKHECKIIELQG